MRSAILGESGFRFIGTCHRQKDLYMRSLLPRSERHAGSGPAFEVPGSPANARRNKCGTSKAGRRKQRIFDAKTELKPTKERALLAARNILEYGYSKETPYKETTVHVKHKVSLVPGVDFEQFQKLVLRAMEDGRLATDFISNNQVANFIESDEVKDRFSISEVTSVDFSPKYLNDLKYLDAVARAVLDGGYSELRITNGKSIFSRYKIELAPDANMDQLRDLILLALIKNKLSTMIITNDETRSLADKGVAKGILVIKLIERTGRN